MREDQGLSFSYQSLVWLLIDRLSDSTRRVAVVRGVESRLRVNPVGFAAFRAQLP